MVRGQTIRYRIVAQNDDVTITTEVAASSMEKAVDLGGKSVSIEKGNYSHFVTLPIASESAYKNGHISFCPRCGSNIAEEMGDDGDDYMNESSFTCTECDAEVYVSIEVPEESPDEEE
ncbi:hypothetical protein [Paenibacillus shenyangensis]|uniref:hypothetical protein n=1 Tax=Paenibacillus sp. A9 TaxID=1284352 RepID=UPI000370808D|nr:hypothetical protein [Paenibacillus sp. A9]